MSHNYNKNTYKPASSSQVPQFGFQSSSNQRPAVVSAAPTFYAPPKRAPPHSSGGSNQSNQVNFTVIHDEVQKQLKRLREKVSVPAEQAIAQGKLSTASQSIVKKQKLSQDKKLLRTAGGQTWHDSTLAEWAEDDFRIFCGDLGNDVTDELLTRTFKVYPSFQRARVVRDRRTNKTKGFGFVSFKSSEDYVKAMREMNGKFVGSRPIKLQKSNWQNRAMEVVKQKQDEKTALLKLINTNPNQ